SSRLVTRSCEKIHYPCFQVVHRPGDLDRAFRLEFCQHSALLTNVADRQLDVFLRHSVNEGGVLRRLVALEYGRLHRRFDLREQACEVAQLDIVDGALDRATGGVAHHQDDLGTRHLAGKFHAAQDVFVCDVAGHADIEDIADPEIHDHFGRRSRVDAAKDYCGGELPPWGGFFFVLGGCG